MLIDLSGQWQVRLSDQTVYPATLPGTLDENHIGKPDKENLATRLTRVAVYEGPAAFFRTFTGPVPEGRLFLEVERARQLSLEIDGRPVEPLEPVTLSSISVFEVTGLLKEGSLITLISDNSYPGWPHDNIVYSSAATDETQTNWNGLLGFIRLNTKPGSFIEHVRVYPFRREDGSFTLDVHVDLNLACAADVDLVLTSEIVPHTRLSLSLPGGRQTYIFGDLPVKDTASLWDEYDGFLNSLKVSLWENSVCRSEKDAVFGLREFSWNQEGRLTLNGRVLWIRSEANCCEFPETGHAPMTYPEWYDVLSTYKSYGINCMRFHSHCPPEAAFYAADTLGMLMQPELSHWNPRTAFESDEAKAYYFTEARAIVRDLANHPSFVMLTFGNELWAGNLGHERMRELIHLLKKQDPTRLYADGSNVHYGQIGCEPAADFYASQKYFSMDLRGTFANMTGFINEEYPSALHTYNDTMAELRKVYQKPVFSFEVGQFEILPDFDELAEFKGVRQPVNLEIVRRRVEDRGLTGRWKQYVEATGEMSLLGYKAEIEAALRTPGMSGISLLGLQDFTGQGTALVGMLNSHLKPKPFDFARPERFHEFFNEVVPLALLPRFTWTDREKMEIPLVIANYGRKNLAGSLEYKITLKGSSQPVRQESMAGEFPMGGLCTVGTAAIKGLHPGAYELVLTVDRYTNRYPLWVYPDRDVVVPSSVHVARSLDDETRRVLASGGTVFLSPPADKNLMSHSIRNQFTTDFWSVGTFPKQEGGMSFLIDQAHPALKGFPTDSHSDYQWWAMSRGLGVEVPADLKSIVTQLDCYAYLRPMTALFEARTGGGRLMFCSMGLMENTQYPEVRALLNSLFAYMDSSEFLPEQTLPLSVIESIFS